MNVCKSPTIACAMRVVVLTCSALASMLGCASTGSDMSYGAATHADAAFRDGAQRQPIPETLYAVSRLLISQGRDNDAEPILRRIIAEHPHYMPAYGELAELQMRNRKLGDAVETLSAAAAIAPNDASFLNNLGMCWMLRSHHDVALEYFTRAVALEPDDARYRANMAAALGMKGRYDEALAVYKQVMSQAQAHHNLAVLCEARGDHEEAAVQYAAARELNPSRHRYRP